MIRRALILTLFAAVFFSLGFLARPSLSRIKHRLRGPSQEETRAVRVWDVTHYTRKAAEYASYPQTRPVVFLGDSRIEWADWGELLNRDDISNRGISGDTTSGIVNRMRTSVPTNAVVCVIQAGINDFSLGASVEEVVANYRQILEYLLKEKQARVVLTPVILVGPDKDHLNRLIHPCNAQLAEIASASGVTWVDLNRALAPEGFLLPRFSDDGVHLNPEGYRAIADLLGPAIPASVRGPDQ